MRRRTVFSMAAGMILCMLTVNAVVAESVEDLMSAGGELLRNGAYDQAVTRFRRVVGMNPGNFEAQFNLAFAYLSWGRYGNAVEEFKKAAGIDPRNSDVWANMGVGYERLGQQQNAINALSKAVNLDPTNVEARLNLASMYANMGHTKRAIAQFEQVISIDGSNPVALTNLAKLMVGENRPREAKYYLREAMAYEPNNAEAHWELGNILRAHDKALDEAEKEYRIAIKLEPDEGAYYNSLGQLLQSRGKKDEALEVYRKSLAFVGDALEKEEIEGRIELLEKGESGAASGGPGTGGSAFHTGSKSEIERLKGELRGEDQAEAVKTVTVDSVPYDVSSELEGLNEEPEDASSFDLKAAAKKRAQENE